MDEVLQAFTVVGASLGLLTFLWRVWDSFLSYLHADLEVDAVRGSGSPAVTALATLENRGSLPKRVHHVGLLLAPEGTSLEEAAALVYSGGGSGEAASGPERDPIAALPGAPGPEPVYGPDRRAAWIPLPFFFRDQRRLGNEVVRYRCPIDTERLLPDACYVVFLVVFVRYRVGILRWRATADLLVT